MKPAVRCWSLPALARLLPDDPRIERRGGYAAFLVAHGRRLPLAPAAAAR